MVALRIYVEGGGDGKALRTRCRRGFAELFERAGFAGRMPKVVACGSRQRAYRDFAIACRQGRDALLLVDSEGPVTTSPDALWPHLRAQDNWEQPEGSRDDQCHLMVQVMETWFLADRQALQRYFGAGFRAKALPATKTIEDIPKADVLKGLEKASAACQKGAYHKGGHSFAILATIDPGRLRAQAPHAERLLRTLDALSGAT